MARPLKSGVDYWPFDVDLFEDKKFKLIKGEFGIKGAFIALCLLNKVYQTNGYYKVWDDDDCLLMSDGVGCGCTPTLVSEVLHRCCERSLFDKRVFDVFGVITSAGIQRRYLRIVANNRDSIPMIQEYWLLDVNDENDVPTGTLNKLVFISKDRKENPVIRKENPDSLKENTTNQSKVNKSKSKHSKSSAREAAQNEVAAPAGASLPTDPDDIEKMIIESIERDILGRHMNPAQQAKVCDLMRWYDSAQMLGAIEKSKRSGGRSIEYIETVLRNNDYASSGAPSQQGMYTSAYDMDEVDALMDEDIYNEPEGYNEQY